MKVYSLYSAYCNLLGYDTNRQSGIYHKVYYRSAILADSLQEADEKARPLYERYGVGLYLGVTFMQDDVADYDDLQLLNDYEGDKVYTQLKASDFSLDEAIQCLGKAVRDYKTPYMIKKTK